MTMTVTGRGYGGSSTAGTSLTLTPSGALASGSLAVLVIAYDNSGTSGADPYSSIADTNSNTWTARHNTLRDPSTAKSGCVFRIFTTKMDGGVLDDTDTITVTVSATAVWAAALLEIAPTSGYSVDYQGTGTGAGGSSTTPSLTTGTITVGDLLIAGIAYETGSYSPTADSDTTNGTWGTQYTARYGSGSTGMCVATQTKIQTTTDSTQTYNTTGWTVAQDFATGYITARETLVGTTVNAPCATASGSTYDPVEQLASFPSVATSSGATQAPTTVAGKYVDAPVASASGSGQDPTSQLREVAPVATSSAASQAPTATGLAITTASAPVATVATAVEWGGSTTGTQVYDTFTGSAVTLASHTPDTGGSWSFLGGSSSSGINGSGYLEQSSLGQDGFYAAAPDLTGDVSVWAQWILGYMGARILLRVIDASNFYYLMWDADGDGGSFSLRRVTAGAVTVLGAQPSGSPWARLRAVGSSPTYLYADDGYDGSGWANEVTTSDNTAGNQSTTGKVGLGLYYYSTYYGPGQLDNFYGYGTVGGAAVGPTVTVINMAWAYPSAGAATGTTQAPVSRVHTFPGAATATAAPQTATVTIGGGGTTVNAPLATASGSANAPTSLVLAAPASVSGTATALAPVAVVSAVPPAATATGAARTPAAFVATFPSVVTSSGSALTPARWVQAASVLATATGSGQAPTLQVATFPSVVTSTAVAQTATVSIIGSGTTVNAPTATGSGATQTPFAFVGAYSAAAASTASVQAPAAQVRKDAPVATASTTPQSPVAISTAFPSTATATGAGQAPVAFATKIANAPVATASASTIAASPRVTAYSGTASASASAQAATVSITGGWVAAYPSTAGATATARAATAAVRVASAFASASAATLAASVSGYIYGGSPEPGPGQTPNASGPSSTSPLGAGTKARPVTGPSDTAGSMLVLSPKPRIGE